MTRRRPATRRIARGPAAAVAVAALAVAGPTVGRADAASRHAPCPDAGTTLLRSSKYASPMFRVSRTGTTLRICTRRPGERRHVRILGTWSAATKIVENLGILAWTTRTTAPDGAAADTIRVIDTTSLRRRLTVTRTAAATSTSSPAGPDTVVGLRTDDLATVWVTAHGRLAAAVQLPSEVPEPYEGPMPFRSGSVYALGDTTPEQAPALAKGLFFVDDSQTDDCGGTASRFLSIPAIPGFARRQFNYFREEVRPGPGC